LFELNSGRLRNTLSEIFSGTLACELFVLSFYFVEGTTSALLCSGILLILFNKRENIFNKALVQWVKSL